LAVPLFVNPLRESYRIRSNFIVDYKEKHGGGGGGETIYKTLPAKNIY